MLNTSTRLSIFAAKSQFQKNVGPRPAPPPRSRRPSSTRFDAALSTPLDRDAKIDHPIGRYASALRAGSEPVTLGGQLRNLLLKPLPGASVHLWPQAGTLEIQQKRVDPMCEQGVVSWVIFGSVSGIVCMDLRVVRNRGARCLF